ncbi:hypothetical protein BRADI_1g04390v3 [Brachypodium distachyon]|uniref:Uncharacterized protein n=1 Tax=Brachypodium distachyon TaxID=15368 RepID=I1GLT2_BRADI|nr:hypothetical protein BRADI_1g04390v3 [Brachypodium distachyon]
MAAPGVTTWEIPSDSDRPAFVESFKSARVPAAATAVRVATPPSEMRTSRPLSATVYLPPPAPEMVYFAKRHAYAYITPADSPFRAAPGPFVRRVFRTLALDLPQTFEILRRSCHGDAALRFRTPDDREAAMRRQPFALDGATVRLVREGETPDVTRTAMDCLALRDYPAEQRRARQDVEENCCAFGFVLEVDPACFVAAAPDLAAVRVVLQLEHPREIPRELRIRYADGSRSVVPVEILRVWDRSESLDANGEHVPVFQPG